MTSRPSSNVCLGWFVPAVLTVELSCAADTGREPAADEPASASGAQRKAPERDAPAEADDEEEASTLELGRECPPGAPFRCEGRCRPSPCPASCERTGCPASFVCKDCGGGADCVAPDAC